MSRNVLEEYLVSLSYQINTQSFQQFIQGLRQAEQAVEKAAGSMTASFATAAVTMVAVLATVSLAVAKLEMSLAKTDMEYQKFALSMWVSNKSAKELKTTLDALGESMEDIAFIPELRGMFGQLLEQGRSMMPPEEYAQQMKDVRAITFEFKRMKLEASFAMEWIGYYLFKYLEGPFRNAKQMLKDFNDMITKNMPIWTEKVAQVLSWIVQLFLTVGRAVYETGSALIRLWESFPEGVKVAIAALTALTAVFMMSPIGVFIMSLTAALILLEDFFGYIDGRESSTTLAPMWKWLLEFMDGVKNSGPMKAMQQSFKEMGEALLKLEEALKRLGIALEATFGAKFREYFQDRLSAWAREFLSDLKMIFDILTFIAEFFTHLMEGDLEKWFRKKLETLQKWGNQNPAGGPNQTPGYIPPGENGPLGGQGSSPGSMGKTWRPETSNVNYTGLKPGSISAIDKLSAWWYGQTGKQMVVSSAYREGDPGGHGRGEKFDVVDDATSEMLERNENGIRDRLIAYAESIGLKVLDEYKYPSAGATAGHLDISAAGFSSDARVAGGTVINNITVSSQPGMNEQTLATKIADAIAPYQAFAQVRMIHQQREVSGVNA